jgi:DNA replication protein DnaC
MASLDSIEGFLEIWDRQLPYDQKERSLQKLTELPPALIKFGEQWVGAKDKTSLFLYGNWGSGKTSFSCAIVRDFLKLVFGKGHFEFPRYVYSRDLDNFLLDAQKKGTDLWEIEKWTSPMILIVDDIDKVVGTESFKQKFFDLMKKRIESNKITIISSNCTPLELTHLLEPALISRMQDKTKWNIIKFPDRDLRKIQLELNTMKF